MQSEYAVVERGADGQPLRIRCSSHDGCTWEAVLRSTKRDDDPIFRALFAQHLRDAVPTRSVAGPLRRRRA
ncbi:MAG TPA: hypothetical protein VFH47_05380 [Candidatus Thermoplasmatota archaeon]|nr:hypothetical protein [Candidatus Thermoplasmatota archaeon]